MNIPSETIVKFKNGTVLHMPFEMYEEISFDKNSIMELEWEEENGISCKVQFSFDDVLYISRVTQSTPKEKQVFKAEIDGKTVSECVSDGVASAIQNSIDDKKI